MLNLINHKPDIDKIYIYAKDPYEAKYQLLINRRVNIDLKYLNDTKALNFEFSNNMDDIYENIEEYNPHKKPKILIVFNDMISDMLSIKKLNSIVTELFIRGRKLNISLVFITQSYFAVPKNTRLNSTHYFVMKIPQIAFNHSTDIDFQDFMNLYKKCTAKSYHFLVFDTTLTSDSLLCFKKNLVERI